MLAPAMIAKSPVTDALSIAIVAPRGLATVSFFVFPALAGVPTASLPKFKCFGVSLSVEVTGVGVAVGVGVRVAVGVGVAVDVAVGVAVSVGLAVTAGVGVGVRVGVAVGDGVLVEVGVTIVVGVADGVDVGVAVGLMLTLAPAISKTPRPNVPAKIIPF